MKYTGEIKNANMLLPEDLHAEMKAEAARRGKTTAEAYQEAAEGWLDPTSYSGKFGKLSAKEEHILCGALLLIRDKMPINDWARRSLLALADQWHKDK